MLLFLLNGLELLQQALNGEAAVLLEGDPQEAQPRVQVHGTPGRGRGQGGRDNSQRRRRVSMEAGPFPEHYQIMRPRDRLSLHKSRAVLFLLSQRLAEVKIKGHNSGLLTMGISSARSSCY